MTGYTVHTGATKKFAEGWERIFDKPAGKPAAKKATAKAAAKKTKKKSGGK